MKLRLERLLFVLVFGMATLPLNARTLFWIGDDIGDLWSNSNNWFTWVNSQSENAVPESGDTLSFEFADLAFNNAAISFNDLTNLTVNSLRFGFDDLELETYIILGNPLRVTTSIYVDYPETLAEIRCGLLLDGGVSIHASAPRGLGYAAKLLVNGPITMEGTAGLTLHTHYAGSIELAAPVSGNGDIRLPPYTPEGGYGALPVKLSGSGGNTFAGTVIMSGDRTLELDKDSGVAVPGPLFIGKNCEVNLKRPHQIADTTKVAITAGGRLRLEGNTDTIRSLCLTNISTDTLATVVSTDGSTLSVSEDIVAANDSASVMPVVGGKLGLPPGSHTIHAAGSQPLGLTISAQIIGGGGFTKTGPGGLLLSGDNTFEGDAVLQEGTTYLYHGNALGGPSGAAILDGGTLSLAGVAVGAKTLWVNRVNRPTSGFGNPPTQAVLSPLDSSWAGPVVLNTNLFVHGGPMTFSGTISGPGGLYLFGFTNRLTGPEANTYTGVTTVDCHLLELDKPSGLTAFRGPSIVGNRGTIALREVRWLRDYQCAGANVTLHFDGLINLYGHREDFGPLTFNGGEISTGIGSGFGELGLYGLVTVNPETSIALISGRLGLPPGLHEFRVGDGAAFPDLRINATVLGVGSLRKTGPGQMWLAASNTYEGLTTVSEGALSVLDPYGLGSSATGTTVDDRATLEINLAGGIMPEPLALRGTGIAGNGALGVFGDVTLRNPFPSIFAAIDLTTDTTIGVAPNATLTVDGFISGIGPLRKAGRGLLVLANLNPNTYSGDTFVAEGVLNLSKPNFAVSVPGDLIIGPAPFNSSATVRFFQNGGMAAGSNVTVNAGSLLDLNGFGQLVTRLNLNDGGDAQTGGGILSFPVGGLVGVSSLSQFGSHSSSYLAGNIGLPANAPLTFAVNAYAPTAPFDFNPELEMFAQVAAPAENPIFERAGIAKTGAGAMKVTANNSFHGRVEVNQGTLIAAGNTALGSAFDGTFVLNNATLELQNGITVADEILVLNSTAVPALFSSAGDNLWNGLITLRRDSTIAVGVGYELRAGWRHRRHRPPHQDRRGHTCFPGTRSQHVRR
jgi:autotransporter-associated beta strand protein